MIVFRFLRKLLFVLFALVGAIVVLVVAAAAIAWRYYPEIEHRVPDQAILTLDLGRGIAERHDASPFAWASFRKVLTMRDLVQALDAAGRDPRVKGLVAKLGRGSLGLAQAQEVRDAVAGFREQGKFAVAFAETFGEAGDGNTHYYLATAFEEIWLQPSGDVGLTGVLLESPFLKGALDAIGVEARMDQREEYKGIMDMFTREGMPTPVRENLQRLADSRAEQLAAGIAAGRGLEASAARILIDHGPFLAAEAKSEKLIDRLGYWDEVEAAVEERAGPDAERMSMADYAATVRAPKDAPRMAIVYGIGPVILADDDSEPYLGQTVMASQRVAAALRKATDAEDVRAIVFRVDSPGGSYVASDSIWREVDRAREKGKPVIVSMAEVAASGGYFVAAPAHKIVAQPGTITGSIGVAGGKFVLSGLWDKLDITWDGVQSGANADIHSFNRDYSLAGWGHVQASLDRVYADFTEKVARGRKLAAERVRDIAKGQVWTGADAKQNGLVDELGGYAVALRLAREAAGLDPTAPVRLDEFPPPEGGLERLLRLLGDSPIGAQGRAEAATLARLVEFLAPVAQALTPLGEEVPALRMPEVRSAR